MSGTAVRSQLKTAGFNADLILANVRKLRKLVETLEGGGSEAGWIEYESCQHVGRDRETKTRFLESALADLGSSRVLDLGANDCHFAERAAAHGATAVAVDGDEPPVAKVPVYVMPEFSVPTTLSKLKVSALAPNEAMASATLANAGAARRANLRFMDPS